MLRYAKEQDGTWRRIGGAWTLPLRSQTAAVLDRKDGSEMVEEEVAPFLVTTLKSLMTLSTLRTSKRAPYSKKNEKHLHNSKNYCTFAQLITKLYRPI